MATPRKTPDAVFGPDVGLDRTPLESPPVTTAGQGSAIIDPAPNLADEVAGLARSLGVSLSPGSRYEPDAFVAAVTRIRDQLLEAKGLLAQQNAEQTQRQADLDAREEDITFREKRANALDRLMGEAPRQGFLSRLFG